MKKYLIITCLLMLAVVSASAQRTRSNYPHWAIGNELQKFQFRNVGFVPATIITHTGPRSSKGIAELQNTPTRRKRPARVTLSGTPSWVISKGVARVQYEKSK
jgi:hypothetical protein